ncbi:Type I restriction enzyme R Protein [Candidatus Desulfarcum epimagneticum]|uniref:Type I restriction enzyme endonuclease subunit n=1 Tax=uncultured Desulfobacteraceae bacterium TaxID=218296 RepID=A0A484HBK8_9BACT|nr:Type I restriction enzyme R Protein [uncultured Desulfobacteraceae bacterium]
MSNPFTEDNLVQQTTADYLFNDLGWDKSVYAFDETFGENGTLGRNNEREVVLVRYLRKKIEALNPNLPEEAYRDAIRKIQREGGASQSTLTANRGNDQIFRNGVEVIFRNKRGERNKKRLRIFDFESPENNHFLIVRELWIKGDVYRRRADIMGYVNGIPLIFMEVKNLHHDIKVAYEKNLSDYKDTVPHLFHHNAFVILGNGLEAKIGSISSKFEYFHDWKRLEEKDPGIVEMETLLKGVCSKENLMDLFENYILFDESAGNPVKIFSRNHQFLGVNKAIRAVESRKKREGKLGVFWHTQGSGKSYSMVFFVKKIHRKLGGNYTFLVLTDRDDLDSQIYQTFAGCGLADNDKDPCRASSGTHLKRLLAEHKSIVFSLIQKFNKDVLPDEPYSNRDDIIVITDEAHRTQYGDLSLNMRNALPNASFIGFTGTPLFSDDEITKRVFGDYVSTYDFQRAVEDGATVPLYYDTRGQKLGVATHDLNERIANKLETFEVDNINVEQRLERELKRDYHIITAGNRLDQIARDLVQHYSEGWENGKAMLVCIDKITCVRMHKLIEFYWQERIRDIEKKSKDIIDEQEMIFHFRRLAWMKETVIAVMISEEQGEVDKFRKWDLDITSHRKLIKQGFLAEDGKRIDLESAFKKEDHPFRVSIVCAMWLTGFDVPCLATLYLDKPLKAHTLMQAIARANRVSEGKNNGLIIDYCGILKNLRKALSTFVGHGDEGHGGVGGGKYPAKPNNELLSELVEAIQLVYDFLKKQGFLLKKLFETEGFARNVAIVEAKEAVNENDQTRKRFEIMARTVLKKFKACINIKPEINEFKVQKNAIHIIYKSLQGDRESVDISHIMRELHSVVDESITIEKESVFDPQTPYDISKIDFNRLKQEFNKSKSKRTTVQCLKAAIEERLEKLLRQNPLRTDFQKHYEQIINEYNQEKDKVTIEKTFEALLRYYKDLDEEQKRAIREGLTQETLAIFDLLVKPELGKNEINQLKKVASSLLKTLKKEKLSIENWREKEATRDAVRQNIFDFLFDDKSGLPVRSYNGDDVKILSNCVFNHIYRAYPTVPSPYYDMGV